MAHPQLWHNRCTLGLSPNCDMAIWLHSAKKSRPCVVCSHWPIWITSPTVLGNFSSNLPNLLAQREAFSIDTSSSLCPTLIINNLTSSLQWKCYKIKYGCFFVYCRLDSGMPNFPCEANFFLLSSNSFYFAFCFLQCRFSFMLYIFVNYY